MADAERCNAGQKSIALPTLHAKIAVMKAGAAAGFVARTILARELAAGELVECAGPSRAAPEPFPRVGRTPARQGLPLVARTPRAAEPRGGLGAPVFPSPAAHQPRAPGLSAVELAIAQRRRDLGGFEVGRVLPFAKRRMVGPFVFFDHMGPVDFPPAIPRSVDVRPHPHIGLATLTYLFAGEIMHRDSVGSEQPIRPGEVNWMTAGRGITHSERFERARREGGSMNGIQMWVALPREGETDPGFLITTPTRCPNRRSGARLRLIAGAALGGKAPVPVHSPLFACTATCSPAGR